MVRAVSAFTKGLELRLLLGDSFYSLSSARQVLVLLCTSGTLPLIWDSFNASFGSLMPPQLQMFSSCFVWPWNSSRCDPMPFFSVYFVNVFTTPAPSFQQAPAAIVLESDVVPSSDFYRYFQFTLRSVADSPTLRQSVFTV